MGGMIAPVDGSGAWPAWMARVAKAWAAFRPSFWSSFWFT